MPNNVDSPMPAVAAAPLTPDALLKRPRLATALSEKGFSTTESTLATLAVRGGGPPFRKFGRAVLYRWSEALAWAENKLSEPMLSTAEARSKASDEAARQAVAATPESSACGQPESRTKAR